MNYFKIAETTLLIMLYCFYLCSASHSSEAYVKSDILEYAKLMIEDKHSMNDNENRSLSVSNNPKGIDKSEILSFADAFLWASGIRTKLSTSEVSRLNFVYLHASPWTENIDIDNAEYKLVFQRAFKDIRDNGPCARVDASNDEGIKFTIVYLDSNQGLDGRLSCIYRHFRSLYGISEKYQLSDFSETFTADLRIIRCKHKKSSADVTKDLYSGRC